MLINNKGSKMKKSKITWSGEYDALGHKIPEIKDNAKLVVKNAKDSQIAFENAKSKGLNNPSEYMYMYSKDNKDYFKNINFRNYISFNQ